MEKRYYLNNMSDSVVTITLSTKRTIKAKSSLPLNSKDVQLFKEFKAKRAGRLSAFNDLRLSTIRIEDDSNYNRPVDNTDSEESIKAQLEAEANELLEDNTEVKDFLEGKTDEVPEGTTEITDEEAARLELEAKAQLEAKANDDKEGEAAEDSETEKDEVTEDSVVETNEKETKSNKKSGLFNFI